MPAYESHQPCAMCSALLILADGYLDQPHQHPCAMCSRRYSLRWEPVRATLIGIVQPPRGLL
jgi:hypothetical protein